jgi:hypothetical protein
MNRFPTLAAAGRLLLGAFVLWQAAFLFAALLANAEEALGDRLGLHRPQALAAADRHALRRYAELTGQRESWALFAPDVEHRLAFVSVELCWDDEGSPPRRPVVLPGKNDPDDINAFVRLGGYRLRKYETYIAPLDVTAGTPAVLFGAPGEGDDRPDATLVYEDQAEQMLAYLRWRVAEFRRERPELPTPTQVWLWVQLYQIPEPPGPTPWRWQYACTVRIGCWVPEYDKSAESGQER